MIKQINLTFLFIVFLASSALAFNPKENRAYKHLNSLDKNGDFITVSKFLNSKEAKNYISTPEDVIAFGVWLRDIHFNPQKDLRYGFLYAKHMQQISQKDTASIAYFVSHLKLLNAISRCDDKNAGSHAMKAWSPAASEFKKYFASIPKSKQESFAEVIVKHAENSINSEPVKWVCLDGISVMNRAIQAGEEGKEINDPNQIGKTITINTEDYVGFILDEEWKKKRKENAEKLKEYLLK